MAKLEVGKWALVDSRKTGGKQGTDWVDLRI